VGYAVMQIACALAAIVLSAAFAFARPEGK
jgi:hypothetical protein